jgi:hypothetical protein
MLIFGLYLYVWDAANIYKVLSRGLGQGSQIGGRPFLTRQARLSGISFNTILQRYLQLLVYYNLEEIYCSRDGSE